MDRESESDRNISQWIILFVWTSKKKIYKLTNKPTNKTENEWMSIYTINDIAKNANHYIGLGDSVIPGIK